MNRGQLEHLSSVLLELHKVLIDSVKTSYERERGQVSNPFELLRLLTSDPFFDWLRPLSRMLADFDELAIVESHRVERLDFGIDLGHGLAPEQGWDGSAVAPH